MKKFSKNPRSWEEATASSFMKFGFLSVQNMSAMSTREIMNNSTPSYESLCLKLRELGVDLSPSDKRLISVADFY